MSLKMLLQLQKKTESWTGMTCIIQSLYSDWITDEDVQNTTVKTSG